jgi:ADP-ribose pyrophosphatase
MSENANNHQYRPLRYTIRAKKPVFEGFFKVWQLEIDHQLFAGGEHTGVIREVFMRGEAVGVLLVDPRQRQVVLVEQFRAGAAAAGADNPWLVELVAGIVEVGEQPEQVAARESMEEAGCEPVRLEPIYEYWVSPGGSDEKFYLFYGEVDAQQAEAFGGLVDEHEDIRVHKVSFEQAYRWLTEGRLNNAMTIIGIQWLMLNESQLIEN